jgi:ADP-heptose:LPS heptosyltransferase
LRSEILTHPRPFPEILLSCSRALGISDQGLKPDIFLSESERETALTLLPASFCSRTLIGVHPGSAGNACNLPSETYSELVTLILKNADCAVVLTGTVDEQELLSHWPRRIIGSDRVWISMGKLDLRQLACVISEMDLFVCSSTGPLHIASAVGTPTVSPFCPTVPLNATIWGNVGAAARVIEPAICPMKTGARHSCNFQGQITASQVFDAIVDTLRSSAVQSRCSNH